MKKLLAMLTACMTLTCVFASCGKDEDDDKEDTKNSVSDSKDNDKDSGKDEEKSTEAKKTEAASKAEDKKDDDDEKDEDSPLNAKPDKSASESDIVGKWEMKESYYEGELITDLSMGFEFYDNGIVGYYQDDEYISADWTLSDGIVTYTEIGGDALELIYSDDTLISTDGESYFLIEKVSSLDIDYSPEDAFEDYWSVYGDDNFVFLFDDGNFTLCETDVNDDDCYFDEDGNFYMDDKPTSDDCVSFDGTNLVIDHERSGLYLKMKRIGDIGSGKYDGIYTLIRNSTDDFEGQDVEILIINGRCYEEDKNLGTYSFDKGVLTIEPSGDDTGELGSGITLRVGCTDDDEIYLIDEDGEEIRLERQDR